MFKIRNLIELKKLPNNPRVIKDKDFTILCESIRNNPEYFNARPIILSDRTGELIIIAGNQRYEAAKHLNLDSVPTYLLSNLTEDQEKEIIIRDNVSNGEWNFDLLANEWDASLLMEWGIDLPIDFAIPHADIENIEVTPKDQNPIFKLIIETKNKINYEFIKKELDRLKITYSELEK